MPTTPLLHLVAAADLDVAAAGPYAPPSPASEGFVHCSSPRQVAGPARLLFAGTAMYGPIPRAVILEVRPYPPGRGGRWSRPEVEPLP